MKKVISILAVCLIWSTQIYAQNPATYPKDSTLSLPEKTFETLWLTFEDNYAFFKLRNID